MPQSFRERVDVTSIIRSILDSYPLGNGILRELLQNSDDASATEQTFILDLRTHPSESLVDPELVQSQGPSLLAVNNSLFETADWNAIRTIHNSSKTQDERKIGKFGIGIRACYHLTDNPQFLSGNTLGIFDPHDRFSGTNAGGVQIDVATEGDNYRDQLAPFDDFLAAARTFPGTVVRLPLRSPQQATKSSIKQTAVDPSEIQALFLDFVQKELSVVMLFLKHIRSICLKVMDSEGFETFIGSAEIPDPLIAEKRAFFQSPPRSETFKCSINVKTVHNEPAVSSLWRVLHSVGSIEETSNILENRLGRGYDVKADLVKDKLFSHVALAFPINHSDVFNGRLFTVLPLPILTRFPAHCHAILALTQDRQSLRNIEEVGTNSISRERFLVTWNQCIFHDFLPAAWSRLLLTLVEEGEVEDVWSAWPTLEHVNDYWKEILPNLVDQVLASELRVFPTFPQGKTHVSLSSALIASPDEKTAILVSLSRVGLSIVQPPCHIHGVLCTSSRSVTFLHPASVRKALLSHISALTEAADEDKGRILEYLVLHPGTVSNAIGLPLVPLVDGRRISLSGTPGDKYVAINEQEEKVFGDCNPNLISLSRMSRRVSEAFCSPAAVNIQISRLNKTNVQFYLESRFGDTDSWHTRFEEKVQWLMQFWGWMARSAWPDKGNLLKLIAQFYLLPTAQGTLRQMHRRVSLPVEDSHTMSAWIKLGVNFLHPHFIPYQLAFRDAVVPAHDIAFLVDNIASESIPSLNEDSARLIQTHITRYLSALPDSSKNGLAKRDVFVHLPIFPIRVPARDTNEHRLSELTLVNASVPLVYIRSDDSCPVPLIPGRSLFDISAMSGILRDVLDPNGNSRVLDEVGVLEMAIDHLDDQPSNNREALVTRIIRRLPDLSPQAKLRLQSVPFVPVAGSSEKLPPNQVIDPESQLASIYRGEPGKLPDDLWAGAGEHFAMLTSQGFLLRQVTPEIAVERITYLSGGTADPSIFSKAKMFLLLLDKHWDSIGQSTDLAKYQEWKWLLTKSKNSFTLSAPKESWDKSGSSYLFDLVLDVVVDVKIHNERLRNALGWTKLPMEVLLSQFREALNFADCRAARLTSLIKEFTHRFSELSAEDFRILKSVVSERPWVPISPVTIAETKYALIQPSSRLRGRFKSVPQDLLDGNGRRFLTEMGCLDKPNLDTLLAELELVAEHPPEREATLQAVDLLTEIGSMISNSTSDLFEDTKTDFKETSRHAAHDRISPALAQELKIQFLSALELGNEDDDFDLQMGEDFTRRVRGVLEEHDVQYALNEYLANAVDAKATEFSIILDERVFEPSKVLTTQLADLQRRPSLFLFNNAVFKAEDFRGLRTVGQGGKGLDPDSIGRYGLGALSLFHFTDVVQLISGDYLLLLDPSGRFLPPLRGKPRTALKMRLSDVLRRYPGHLSCFDSLHGFSSSDAHYEGTLFRLPLRKENECTSASISPTAHTISTCQNLISGPYRGLAKDAMYFTSLEQVSASHREPVGGITSLWSVSASRSAKTVFKHPLTHEIVILDLDSKKWLVTKAITPPACVPDEYRPVLAEMKLDSSKIGLVVQMAFPLDEMGGLAHPSRPSHLFSSLRLPVQSSLPAHIHAQFALSSDRRHIRFEPPDGSGTRMDP
ncbi:hypothetical protein B0H19DRAFT_1384430, partial [Mycena capillaripes]